jgi:putative FmdB family regulatory protein
MPTYDFVCLDCRRRFDLFMTYSEYGTKPAACSHCGSKNVRRRVPRVRVLKGEEAHLERFANPAALDGLEDDPRALGRMMREMGSTLGEEAPSEFGEVVDRLESGQKIDDIEKEMPDLGESVGSDQ